MRIDELLFKKKLMTERLKEIPTVDLVMLWDHLEQELKTRGYL